jgi:hypothetical protein
MRITAQELATLNGYCASALFNARLLGRMVRRTQDIRLRLELARRANDALRHAQIWAETIRALGERPQALASGFQERYEAFAGRPDTLVRTLVLTQTFERRLARQLLRHFHRDEIDPIVRSTLRRMLEEEIQPGWMNGWLSADGGLDEDAIRVAQARYASADAAVGDPFAQPIEQQQAA